jgi:Tol biopolymer transport system component
VQALLLAALLAVHPAGSTVVNDWLPTWSPDGKHIAFVRTTRRTSVFVVRPDGSGLRRIGSSAFQSPVWAPDGKTLAIVRPYRGDRAAIVLARLDGSRTRQVALGGFPAWAPKGRRIAFMRGAGIAVVEVRSKRVRQLRLETSIDFPSAGWPTWSPDGGRIAIDLGGLVGVVSAKGGPVLLLGGGWGPAWSPDGAMIAAGCSRGVLVAFFSPTTPGGGCTGGPLQSSTGRPRWSPDGRRIAVSGCSYPSDDCTIWIQRRGDYQKQVLALGENPSWSPNGRTIVFARAGGDSTTSHLYLMAADGSRVRPLFP